MFQTGGVAYLQGLGLFWSMNEERRVLLSKAQKIPISVLEITPYRFGPERKLTKQTIREVGVVWIHAKVQS